MWPRRPEGGSAALRESGDRGSPRRQGANIVSRVAHRAVLAGDLSAPTERRATLAEVAGSGVVAVGHGLMDELAEVDEAVLVAHGGPKGSMSLVDLDSAERLRRVAPPRLRCAGGAAANTAVGVSLLGVPASFVGHVADDEHGRAFVDDLEAMGVEFLGTVSPGDAPGGERMGTGRCLVMVTPDGERTMHTHLGAAARLRPEHVDRAAVRGAEWALLEGYLWDSPAGAEAALAVAEAVREGGGRVAVSLSDARCVTRHRGAFAELVRGGVDLVLGNEEEVLALAGVPELGRALSLLVGPDLVVVTTRGPAGSVVASSSGTTSVEAVPVSRVVDGTGAGDFYAAGFLAARCRGVDLDQAAWEGSVVASSVLEVVGTRPIVSLPPLVRAHAGLA